MTQYMTPETINEIVRLHGSYRTMLARCYTKTNASYKDYGGRGIYVTEEWHIFSTFAIWAITNGAAPGLHLDRVDNDGPYSPDNCRFVAPKINMNNRRSNSLLTAFGETKNLTEWLNDDRCVVTYASLKQRISKYGWDSEKAITTSLDTWRNSVKFTAFGETKTAHGWAKDPRCVVGDSTLRARVVNYNWDVERALTTPSRVKKEI